MRISDLSATTGVPVATIKYYLRAGLIPAGRALSATQAEYDEHHVARLRMVRALVEVAGLPLTAVRAVLVALDCDSLPTAIGAAHEALSAGSDGPVVQRATDLVSRLGWQFHPGSASLRRLESALAALEAVGLAADTAILDRYARAALELAEDDIDGIPEEAEDAVRYVVLGTVLFEPLLLALRRLAQAHFYGRASATRNEGPGAEPGPSNG
jgi:DNA-binding transcriptional MerR regulator